MDRIQRARLEETHMMLTGASTPAGYANRGQSVADLIDSMSPRERAATTELLTRFDRENYLGLSLTVRGIKPLTCLPDIEVGDPELVTLNSFIARIHNLPSSNVLLFQTSETISNLPVKGSRNLERKLVFPWAIHRQAAEQMIAANIDLFEQALQRPIEPSRLVNEIAACSDIGMRTINDGVLLGVLFGYGRDNALRHQEIEFLTAFLNDDYRFKLPLGYHSFLNESLNRHYSGLDIDQTRRELRLLLRRWEAVGGGDSQNWLDSVPRFFSIPGNRDASEFLDRCRAELPEITRVYNEGRILHDIMGRICSAEGPLN